MTILVSHQAAPHILQQNCAHGAQYSALCEYFSLYLLGLGFAERSSEHVAISAVAALYISFEFHVWCACRILLRLLYQSISCCAVIFIKTGTH